MSIATRAIHTKLRPPQAVGIIPRERLLAPPQWLDGQYRLTTMVAPAGYGKSTTMSQWFVQSSASNHNVAWLSLDENENDPARLIAYLIYSLQMVHKDFCSVALSQLEGGSPPSFQPLLESLLAEIADDCKTAIFLDDFHLITNPVCHQLIEWLINNAPVSMTFIIGSRNKPPLALSSLQLQDAVLALKAKDLTFSEEESQRFMLESTDLVLDSDEAQTLWQRTEGWPAALRLAALSMRDVADPKAFIQTFSGSDRYITDYLGEAVLAQLPLQLQQFLLNSAVLDRMCSELCTEVTDEAGSQALLEDIERRNLFLLPLDQERKWYRYHHLLSDFLRGKLERDSPGKSQALRSKAAQWCFSQGFREEAIRYALSASNYAQAAKWIAGCAEELVQLHGEHTTLLNWITQLPESALSSWPTIRINHAWSLSFNRRFEEAEQELKKLEVYRDDLRAQSNSSSAQQKIAQINREVQLQRCINFALQDRHEESRLTSDTWLQTWQDADWFQKGVVGVVLGFSCKCTSEFELGVNALCAAREALIKCNGHYGKAWADMVYTVLLATQGRHREAMSMCQQGLAYADQKLGPHSHAKNMLSALMAAMHYERNELVEARANLQDGLAHVQRESSVDPLIAAHLTAARLRIVDNRIDQAMEILDEGIDLGRARDFPRLIATLLYEQVCIHLRHGNIEQAVQLAHREGFLNSYAIKSYNNAVRSLSKRIQVRIAIAQNNPSVATQVLNALIQRARTQSQHRKLVELLILKALALKVARKPEEALDIIREAIELSADESYIRAFVDEGDAIKPLLLQLYTSQKELLSRDAPVALLIQRLAQEFGITDDMQPEDIVAPMESEPLTSKESQILLLLGSGKTNQQIADSLFVTTGTIKWHLHNLYGKLMVGNRTEALARARALGLLH